MSTFAGESELMCGRCSGWFDPAACGDGDEICPRCNAATPGDTRADGTDQNADQTFRFVPSSSGAAHERAVHTVPPQSLMRIIGYWQNSKTLQRLSGLDGNS